MKILGSQILSEWRLCLKHIALRKESYQVKAKDTLYSSTFSSSPSDCSIFLVSLFSSIYSLNVELSDTCSTYNFNKWHKSLSELIRDQLISHISFTNFKILCFYVITNYFNISWILKCAKWSFGLNSHNHICPSWSPLIKLYLLLLFSTSSIHFNNKLCWIFLLRCILNPTISSNLYAIQNTVISHLSWPSSTLALLYVSL